MVIKMIRDFIDKAKRGESLFICDVRDAFASADAAVDCVIETAVGETRHWTIPLPRSQDTQDAKFVRDYFHANIYNLISTFGGKYMSLYITPGDEFTKELCNELDDVFQTAAPKVDRYGYGKCLNVTDRVNAAFGRPPFNFIIEPIQRMTPDLNPAKNPDLSATTFYQKAVKTAQNSKLCGLDIGGSDIKAICTSSSRIISLNEYDWNPTRMTKIEQMIEPIINIVKHMQAELGESVLFDGIGIGFPDVVIQNKIVGGETLKTHGIRAASPNYETEFARLLELGDMLRVHCKPMGKVNMTNDGSLAAYTAAVELAHSDRSAEVSKGVFAHTLGTELGTGWVDENGNIPQIPLEIYNCIIDMGNFPAREFEPFDLRSSRNFNTGIPGTMQKYASQSGAYRMALKHFSTDAPQLYQELYDEGFIEEKNGGVYVSLTPEDKRKALLAYIMKQADEGQPQAELVFRDIGRCLAATWRETEFLLCPQVKKRVLYGRFVKSRSCLKLMQEGAREMLDVELEPGDDDLAFTPLMQALKADPTYTVAQFGQAVGAAHFAASCL